MAILPQDQFDAAILDLVNQERTSRGLVPLSLSAKLDAAADLQSRQMAEQDFFDHNNPVTGSTIGSRARGQGYTIVENQWGVGENIAAGQLTPESVMTGWMNSPGHRDNILNPNYRHFGVGYYYLANDTGRINYNRYWTQVFGFGGAPGKYQAENSSPSPSQPTVLEGTSAGDLLVGTSVANTIKGFDGNDTIKGAGGNDALYGGRRGDRLYGGTGNDLLFGGEHNDTLYGGQRGDRLYGGTGNDLLFGGKHNDTLNGGRGSDKLIGVNLSDSNNIIGRGEKDTLIGNSGADTYVLGQNSKVFYDDRQASTSGNQDYGLIMGFNLKEGDRIQLEGRASDYVLGQSGQNLPQGTKIYLENNNGPNELIGIVKNVTINSLNSAAFRFV